MEVFHEDFVIDSRRHKNDLQTRVMSHKFFELKEKDVSIYRTFVYLR